MVVENNVVDVIPSSSYTDLIRPTVISSTADKRMSNGVDVRVGGESRSSTSSGSYQKLHKVRHVPSFYDNIPLSPTNHYASSEERMEVETGAGDAGGAAFSYTQKSQYSKTSETSTTYVKNLTDVKTKYRKNTRHDNAVISSGPDYITNVEVDPEWRYSYGSSSSTSQKSPQASPANPAVYPVGSQNNSDTSPGRKPGKFPITPDDLWGSSMAASPTTKQRSVNTVV